MNSMFMFSALEMLKSKLPVCKITNKQKTPDNCDKFHCSKILCCMVSLEPSLGFLEEEQLYIQKWLNSSACFIRDEKRKPSSLAGGYQNAWLWWTAHSSSINNHTFYFTYC